MPYLTYLLLVFTTFFWGGTFIAGRLLAGQVPPLSASFLRFFIATISLFFIHLIYEGPPKRPTGRQAVFLTLLGLTGVFAYNLFFFTGLTYISAGRAALIIATTPLAITICSALIFRETITPLKGFGILLSLTGALFVISNGHPSMIFTGGFGTGEKALLGCVVSWTAYTIIGRSILSSMSPLTSVFYSAAIGTVLLALPAFQEGLLSSLPGLTPSSWTCLAYLGICGTALGFSWYYKGIITIGATRSGVFINLVPVFALLLSRLILAESIKVSVVTGGALVLLGVFLTNRPATRHKV